MVAVSLYLLLRQFGKPPDTLSVRALARGGFGEQLCGGLFSLGEGEAADFGWGIGASCPSGASGERGVGGLCWWRSPCAGGAGTVPWLQQLCPAGASLCPLPGTRVCPIDDKHHEL